MYFVFIRMLRGLKALHDPYDNKSDIRSLGCVTYEMLTLHPPFRAENMEELYQKVIKG